ncbi:neutral zinc metallopeptidase [Cellulomonas sp. PhB150]|uniref:KPN_02809 family neutral zinc metallopeptidase n=1 Tax=Cellulomonas sp. PhB150 TaxID=2485188 RepID=UPI000F495AA8|nr:neutral zinc metallopeptidase [Cellulomonas sp. PhB150]ROS30394.1 hypothetical protein EDF34_0030 [Cellulomonas sp. PhB150]
MTFQGDGSFGGGRVKTGGGRGKVVAGGGGAVGLIVVLVYLFTGVDLGGGTDGSAAPEASTGTLGSCSVEQANTDRQCRLAATAYALDTYWDTTLTAAGVEFSQPDIQSFTQAVSTGCGDATSASGPFYCPPDATIYLDVSFYDELESQFGGEDGPLAEEYVTAHEYGHHIQNITGVMDQADRGGTGAESDSVRVELQADCYAGMWAGDAASTINPETKEPYLAPITAEQLQNALGTAAAVGDDHIQEQSGGSVNPDTWTHGSSEERQRWFTRGYEKGTLEACDTFAADSL